MSTMFLKIFSLTSLVFRSFSSQRAPTQFPEEIVANPVLSLKQPPSYYLSPVATGHHFS